MRPFSRFRNISNAISTASASRQSNRVLQPGDRIASKYLVTEKLGEGSSGTVYAAVDQHSRRYAVKFEKLRGQTLAMEFQVFRDIATDQHGNTAIGIPRTFYLGQIHEHNVLVMDLLGSSLFDTVTNTGCFISEKSCLMIAIQLISIIEHIHNCGYIHRDIKPDNILTGLASNDRQIHLVDYGLAKQYRDAVTGRHYEYKEGTPFRGTARYASANVMKGTQASRRDDLETLAYTLMDLKNGSLPWRKTVPSGMGLESFRTSVLVMKTELDLEKFSEGFPGMLDYMRHVRSLRFAKEPRYSYLRSCFEKALEGLSLQNDGNFDWIQN